MPAMSGFQSTSTAGRTVLVSAIEDERSRALARSVCQLRYLGRNKPGEPQITRGGGSPKWNKFPDSHYLTALWERGPPLTGYWRESGCLPVPPLPRVTARRPRLGLHSQCRGAGLGGTGGDLEGAKFRKGPRGGLLKLAGASSFCLLLSGFLSRSRTLSPLPALIPLSSLRSDSVCGVS